MQISARFIFPLGDYCGASVRSVNNPFDKGEIIRLRYPIKFAKDPEKEYGPLSAP